MTSRRLSDVRPEAARILDARIRYRHLSPAAVDAAIRLLEQPAGATQVNRDVQSFGDGVETGS